LGWEKDLAQARERDSVTETEKGQVSVAGWVMARGLPREEGFPPRA
jgi:hypothetical protein